MYGGFLFLGVGSFRTPGSVLYTSVQPNHIVNIPLSRVLVAILSASVSLQALPAFPCSFIFHSLPPPKPSTWATASQGTWTDLVCLLFSGPNTVVRCRFLKKPLLLYHSPAQDPSVTTLYSHEKLSPWFPLVSKVSWPSTQWVCHEDTQIQPYPALKSLSHLQSCMLFPFPKMLFLPIELMWLIFKDPILVLPIYTSNI